MAISSPDPDERLASGAAFGHRLCSCTLWKPRSLGVSARCVRKTFGLDFYQQSPNCSGRIQYPVAPPDPPHGMYWRDALFNEPFEILDGSTMAASTKPLVLVLEPSYAVS